MTNPTPSPAPQQDDRATLAAIECFLVLKDHWRVEPIVPVSDETDLTALSVEKAAAIITKHAAALSEENQKLRDEVERLRNAGNGLGMATHAELQETFKTVETIVALREELTTLRLWSEQAREAAKHLNEANVTAYISKHLTFLQSEYQEAKDANLPNPWPGADEKTLEDLRKAENALALLQSHPAATNKTEDGK